MENISQIINKTQINNSVITEKNYQITILWIFKTAIIFILLNILSLFFGYYIPYLLLVIPIMLIANYLIRKNFHYSLDKEYFKISQGVISKKQNNLPYGVIQNVYVKQDLFDRIFKLASLKVENASVGGGETKKIKSFSIISSNSDNESVGASGNKIYIPGLKKKDAEELKNYILQKIKENPLEDNQSGL